MSCINIALVAAFPSLLVEAIVILQQYYRVKFTYVL
jgi:hypothetical protein